MAPTETSVQAEKADASEEDLRQALASALRGEGFDSLSVGDRADAAEPNRRVALRGPTAFDFVGLPGEADVQRRPLQVALLLWGPLAIAWTVAYAVNGRIRGYVFATLGTILLVASVAMAVSRLVRKADFLRSLRVALRVRAATARLTVLSVTVGIAVTVVSGVGAVVQTHGLAVLVAGASAALYTAASTLLSTVRGRFPHVEHGIALVLSIGFLFLFALLFSAEMWTVAREVSRDWWPSVLLAPLALAPLVFFLFRQLRDSIDTAFREEGKKLKEEGGGQVVTDVFTLLDKYLPAEKRLSGVSRVLPSAAQSSEGAQGLRSERTRDLIERALRTAEARAASIGAAMKKQFELPLLISLVLITVGIIALMTVFMYVLASVAIDVEVAGGWLHPADESPPPVPKMPHLPLPASPYPVVAGILGTLAAAVFLAFALTDPRYRAVLVERAIEAPARRCLLLGIPYTYLLAKHDHRDQAPVVRNASGRLKDDNTFATADESDDWPERDTAGRSLWYRWRPPEAGQYKFSAGSEAFTPVVFVRKVSGEARASVGQSVDGGRTVVFQAGADDEFQIAVDARRVTSHHGAREGGRRGQGGKDSGPFTLEWSPAPPPPNTAIGDAEPLAGERGSANGTTMYALNGSCATQEAEQVGSGSVWFRWVPPTDGWISFAVSGQDGTLRVTACARGEDARVHPVSHVHRVKAGHIMFLASADADYLITVDTVDGVWGEFMLAWEPSPAPPTNRVFSGAEKIEGMEGRIGGRNELASDEPGEPAHAGKPGGRSLWYLWRAPADGWVTFQTKGSDFDTLLAVYTGEAVDDLAPIAANDDDVGAGVLTSRVRFLAESGSDYYIAVDGWQGRTGNVELSWRPDPPPPRNYVFSGAEKIEGMEGRIGGRNELSSKEAGEPAHAGNPGGRSLWYLWRAPADGWVTFQTKGSDFDTLLAVYTGEAVDDLSPIAANDDAWRDRTSRVRFLAESGSDYYIAVDGWQGRAGNVQLTWKGLRGLHSLAYSAVHEVTHRWRGS